MTWREVQRFRDVKVGDRVKLVQPEVVRPADDPDVELGPFISRYRENEGIATHVNPRGEIWMDSINRSFLEDAVHGDWFYSIYVWEESP